MCDYIMSFSRIRSPIRCCYVIDEAVLKRVVEIRDLGVTFTEDLSFNKHVEIVIATACSNAWVFEEGVSRL